MNQLVVVAEATNGTVFAGGSSTGIEDYAGPIIAVSVCKPDGTPVKALKRANFVVHLLPGDQLNPSFIQATLFQAQEQSSGIYVLALQPLPVVAPTGGQKFTYAIAGSSQLKNRGANPHHAC